ncbi:hypothetical protein C2S53_009382 [Perilla frutescens var. hirtella]|uniref:BHLH domain-containing protein n=1 Tax=Perilla frutescens var. hirtella TaxID=608512 RepID=A0AAD4JCE9_PERFH|nr:hypothetical protein C2S53_009382 [Perilla frutescens var. hirtella]
MSDVEESSEIRNCDEQRLWYENSNEAAAYCTSNSIGGFDEVSSFPLQEAMNPINADVVFDPMETTRVEEDGVKDDSDRSDHNNQQKRTRCAEMHNHNERLRRQRLKEKIKALQELIPNCSKRDKSSTFDDAIQYIKTLQNQVQMMSTGASYSTLKSPLPMMPHPHPHPRQQGMHIPNPPPFLQTGSPSIGIKYGIGTETGTGMSAMFPSLDFPGLPNQCLLPSSATSRMPLNFTSPNIESHGSKSTSQGPVVSEQSTTRVLPSKVVQPHHSKEVMDYIYGCGHSGQTEEWSSSSTTKWKDPLQGTGEADDGGLGCR